MRVSVVYSVFSPPRAYVLALLSLRGDRGCVVPRMVRPIRGKASTYDTTLGVLPLTSRRPTGVGKMLPACGQLRPCGTTCRRGRCIVATRLPTSPRPWESVLLRFAVANNIGPRMTRSTSAPLQSPPAHRLHRAPHARRAHVSSSSRSRSLHAFCSTSTRTSSPRHRALEQRTMLSASLQSLRLRSSSTTTTSSSHYPQSLPLQLGLRVLSVPHM